jgi:hypothetical protein
MIPNNFHFIESIPLLYTEMLISETAVINIYIYIYLADVGDIRVLNFSCKDPLRDTSCMNNLASLELIFGRDTTE